MHNRVYRLRLTRHGTVRYVAEAHDTRDSALLAACAELSKGGIDDLWIEDSDHNRIAFTEIQEWCRARGA